MLVTHSVHLASTNFANPVIVEMQRKLSLTGTTAQRAEWHGRMAAASRLADIQEEAVWSSIQVAT
jgi:hypothetical protein